MFDKNPLVSIIIPSKNRPELVQKAIDSVLGQTYQNIEIIVVDDRSDVPLSPILADKYANYIACYRFDQSLGASAARNYGLRNAVGEFVAFLDDDDIWLPRKLEKQLHEFGKADIECCLVGCLSAYQNLNGPPTCKVQPCPDSLFEQLLTGNVIGGCSLPLIRRSSLVEVGGFDEQFESCQDWELWLRILRTGTARFVPEVLVARGAYGGQITTNLGRKIAGRQRLLQKFSSDFSRYGQILFLHLRRLGTLKLAVGDRIGARTMYLQALKIKKHDIRNLIGLFLSYLPVSAGVRLARRVGASRFDDVTLYH